MKSDCAKWKDELLEAALLGSPTSSLREHLLACVKCTKELGILRARRERMDALLPLVARGAEPREQFGIRVLNAVEAEGGSLRAGYRRRWVWAGAPAVVAFALMLGWLLRPPATPTGSPAEVASAQKLAEWQAPSDVLLETPGQEVLRSTPKLGETYLKITLQTGKEE